MKHFTLLNQATGQDVGLTAPTAEIAVTHAALTFPNGTGETPIYDRVLGLKPTPQMAAVSEEQVQAALDSPEYQTITRGRWSVACGDWATFTNGKPEPDVVRAALRS